MLCTTALFCLDSFLGLAYMAAVEVLGRFVELGGTLCEHFARWGGATDTLPPVLRRTFILRRARVVSFACAAVVVRGWERLGRYLCASYAAQHRDMGLETCTDRQCCSPTAAWRLSVG